MSVVLGSGDYVYVATVSHTVNVDKNGKEKRKKTKILVRDVSCYTAQVKTQEWLDKDKSFVDYEIESVSQTKFHPEIVL